MIINEKQRLVWFVNLTLGFSALAKSATETGNIIKNSNGPSYEKILFVSGDSSRETEGVSKLTKENNELTSSKVVSNKEGVAK